MGFQGFIAIGNGGSVFEGRATNLASWTVCFIRDALIVDAPSDLVLGRSYAVVTDSFKDATEMGGPHTEGILLPWNEVAGGGMLVDNVTFVNFANPCLRCGAPHPTVLSFLCGFVLFTF